MVMWKPFGIFVLNIKGHTVIAAAVAMMALTINIMVNMKEIRKILSMKTMQIWTLLTVYSILNNLIKGYSTATISVGGGLTFFLINYIMPYTLLLLALIELRRDRWKTLKILMYATFFFTFITVSLTKVGGESRYTAESSEIGNDLAITGVVLILLAMIRYAAGRLKIIYPEGITLYVMVITLLTETRTALGAGVILVFMMITLGLTAFSLIIFGIPWRHLF